MSNLKISVVIIVYNQYESLLKVMKGFKTQTVSNNEYEIILIDDGSTDKLATFEASDIPEMQQLKVYHTINQGRAAGRNFGASIAKGEMIIFCDGDRVPCPTLIEEFYDSIEEGNEVVIGASYDYFGKEKEFEQEELDWKIVLKYSRLPSYYRRIIKLYDENGNSNSNLVWLSLLIGNACILKSKFDEIGGFNEQFKEWGFEHFDLGYRLCQNNVKYKLNKRAHNYHIPHLREKGFYENKIIKNIELFQSMYPEINTNMLYGIFIEGKDLKELL